MAAMAPRDQQPLSKGAQLPDVSWAEPDAYGFLRPLPELRGLDGQELCLALGIPVPVTRQPRWAAQAGKSGVFDEVLERTHSSSVLAQFQCTAQYYFDVCREVVSWAPTPGRVVEVGVFMGGASIALAGAVRATESGYDMVDTSPHYLWFAYETVRRTFPEVADRIRLWCGDLPSYVQQVLQVEEVSHVLVEHDGPHDFNNVVRDLGSLAYVRDKVDAVMIQDTHLRAGPWVLNFVDAAVRAVFGEAPNRRAIGHIFSEEEVAGKRDPMFGNYVLPGLPEGVLIPFLGNPHKYPDDIIKLQDFQRPEVGQGWWKRGLII